MTLAQKLASRQLVLDYLAAVKQQAETDLGADNLSDDQWHRAAQRLADANANLIKAKTGRGWEPFYDDAKSAFEGF